MKLFLFWCKLYTFAGTEEHVSSRPIMTHLQSFNRSPSRPIMTHLQSFNRCPTSSSVLHTFGFTQKVMSKPTILDVSQLLQNRMDSLRDTLHVIIMWKIDHPGHVWNIIQKNCNFFFSSLQHMHMMWTRAAYYLFQLN